MPALIDARKLTTVVWSFLFGTILYVLIRLIVTKTICNDAYIRLVKKVNSTLVDEIGYRSVLIGFPVFTLGALDFCDDLGTRSMGPFLGLGSKRSMGTNYMVILCSFSSFRLSKGWEGKKTAWLAVIGFAIIMFNLVVVNLVIAGLHSYA